MKHRVIFLLCIILVFFASSATSEELQEHFYDQLNRAVIRLEHLETINKEGTKEILVKNVPDGTAFFVFTNNVFTNNDLFIVSARHVVEQPYDLHARVQCRNEKTGEREVILLRLPRSEWTFHENKGDKDTYYVDVAVMKLFGIKDRSIKGFRYEPKGSPEQNKNQLPMEDPEPPQAILVFGFPANVGFELMEQKPLARLGVVSMKTGKKFIKLDSGKFAEERCCLIDARIFGGNSGSPVMNQMIIGDSEPRLLGLVEAVNIGLDFAVMEPVSRIRETLDLAKDKAKAGSWEEIRK
jgi:hypothetical protein